MKKVLAKPGNDIKLRLTASMYSLRRSFYKIPAPSRHLLHPSSFILPPSSLILFLKLIDDQKMGLMS